MSYEIKGDFSGDFYNRINRNVTDLPKRFKTEFKKQTLKPINNLRKRLRREPSRLPSHPFIWSFDAAAQGRARRWWFAALAGKLPGVTIPTDGTRYQRTGAGVKNIKVVTNRPEGQIQVFIPEGMRFVVGREQVPSHARTGWKNIPEEVEVASVQFLDKAIDIWADLADRIDE